MSKKKKLQAKIDVFNKVVSGLLRDDLGSITYEKKNKYHNGTWLEGPAYAPPVLPPYPPAVFENELLNNLTTIREGNNIPDYMVLDSRIDGGFFFGRRKGCRDNFYIGKSQNRDGHILVVGGPGSHKTSGIVIPTIETWKGHIIVVDVKPKGPLLNLCYLTGKRVMVFNPLSGDSSGFDPYSFLLEDGDANLASNALELAQALIPSMPEAKEPIWRNLAQSLLAGVIINDVSSGATFIDTMTKIQLSSVGDLISEIIGSKCTRAKLFVSEIKELKPETLAGIGMDLQPLAILTADPHIKSVLCGEEKTNVKGLVNSALCDKGRTDVIDWNELNITTDPVIIVLQIPEENLDVWKPLTMLLVNQLIQILKRRPDKYSKDGENLPPVLIMLDEFASLGKIASIESGLATLRSRGVTFCLVVQSLAQLDRIYGKEARRIIVENCSYKAILNVTEPESQNYLSDVDFTPLGAHH